MYLDTHIYSTFKDQRQTFHAVKWSNGGKGSNITQGREDEKGQK